MLTTVTVALLFALQPPAISFRGAAKNGVLVFEMSNPNAEPLPYLGYTPDSLEGGLPKGTIAPLYRVDVLRGKQWKPYRMGWCGTDLGDVSIPGKGKATFAVGLPDGDWQRFRVGVTWYTTAGRKESGVAWSDAVSRDDIARKKP
jgi:hypothetical protein